ncbi:MAG: dolichol kinase [Candidatus Kryptonium sp.]|nr:dolichol kinase [Candidatus Kryptonium sp.]MCX7761996.1 dolichol kinase [Candidatus Kryptonium sp.]MDW8108672.1 dolichol kinase [Candidatus Kryptonium sp.]
MKLLQEYLQTLNQRINEISKVPDYSEAIIDFNKNIDRNYKAEYIRKAIHQFSMLIPVIYYFTPRDLAIKILIVLTLGFLTVDIIRYYNPTVQKLFYKFFGFILRQHERDHKVKNLNGATWVFISALVCVIIFPKFIVINAFAILILSDASAAVFGRKFGKHKFFKKSLEGTIAFILAAVPVVLLAPKVQNLPGEYIITMASAIVGGIIEAASINLKVDDNLLIPVSIGATMWILYLIFYPNLDLYFLK